MTAYRAGSVAAIAKLSPCTSNGQDRLSNPLTSTSPRNPIPCRAYLSACGARYARPCPQAEEVISYKIPTYKLPGGPVLYFAGWKQHVSLYPATAHVVEAFRDEITPYLVSKSTLRFPLSQPVPVKLIGRIARFRAMEVAERNQANAGKAKEAVSPLQQLSFYFSTVNPIEAVRDGMHAPGRPRPRFAAGHRRGRPAALTNGSIANGPGRQASRPIYSAKPDRV